MTQYIGQITIIIETETSALASETLSFLAKQLDDTRPEVIFADHNGDVEDYEAIERECEESLTSQAKGVLPLLPLLLASLEECARLLADYEGHSGEEGDAYRQAVTALTIASKCFPDAVPATEGLHTPFDNYEIHGIREFGKGRSKYCEQVPDDEAKFWSLFGHIPGQGLDCIGDFATREHAEEVYARITGRRYGSRS